MKKIIFLFLIGLSILTSCQNQEAEFADYKYTTVYFPYQSPVRTIVLGTDYVYDNSLDVAHQCVIYATMGGVYSNKTTRTLDVVVDNSLCNNLKFGNAGGGAILPMPSNYYTLPANTQIEISSGSVMGGLNVQLTDAFFADPLALKNTYVIPLRITKVTNADSILSGKAGVGSPNRFIAGDWITAPKDYVLYAIKYKNPWDATYLRRGTEIAPDTTAIYHKKYVEYDQLVTSVTSKSLTQISIGLSTTRKDISKNTAFNMLLTFNDKGECTASNPPSTAYTITGTGKYVKDGDMWGNRKRDVLYLDYKVDIAGAVHTMKDTLVMRDRVEKVELFTPVYKN